MAYLQLRPCLESIAVYAAKSPISLHKCGALVSHPCPIAGFDSVSIKQRRANAKSISTGVYVALNRAEIHAASGKQFDLGERSLDRFNVSRPERFGGKDLHHGRAEMPGFGDFGGTKRAGKDRDVFADAASDDFPLQRGCDNK